MNNRLDFVFLFLDEASDLVGCFPRAISHIEDGVSDFSNRVRERDTYADQSVLSSDGSVSGLIESSLS